jgi:hypothetical protein
MMTGNTHRKHLVWLCIAFVGLPGCDRETHTPSVAMALETAPLRATLAKSTEHYKAGNLAYEHTVSVELGKALLPTRMQEIQTACVTDKQFDCKLLDISVRTAEDVPSGSIRMRLAPDGVEAFISIASKDAAVTSRITHAEDLTEQVTDTERELSQLTTHRDRLAEFMKDKSLKVDQVIAVSRELSSVQTQIEATSAARLNLHRRIDTEVLTLNLSIPRQVAASQRTPIRDALNSFGTEFTDALAQVIRFVAALIPWLVIIVPGLVLVQLFWRMIGRWLARREAR